MARRSLDLPSREREGSWTSITSGYDDRLGSVPGSVPGALILTHASIFSLPLMNTEGEGPATVTAGFQATARCKNQTPGQFDKSAQS